MTLHLPQRGTIMAEKIIKASFKNCSIEDRKTFHKARCIMPISIGQKIHEGEKFIATLRLVERSFRECTLLLDDSIQKYTLKITSNKDLEELHKDSFDAGTAWLDRQENALKTFKASYSIMRWDDWVMMPEFPEHHKMVTEMYYHNKTYKDSFQQNITDFLTSFKKDALLFDYDNAEKLCLAYLLEECAVMTLWARYKYDFELYPNGRNKAMTATYDLLIKESYPDSLKEVALRFKKYEPQTKTDISKELVNS